MIPGWLHPRAPLCHLLGQSQAAPLLTHLRLHRPWLPDVRGWFQEATLSFCLRHDQARHFISQAFQSTPEPAGLITALAMKGRQVRAPGHLREGLGEAWETRAPTDYRCSLWGVRCCHERREAPTLVLPGWPPVVFTWPQTVWAIQGLH